MMTRALIFISIAISLLGCSNQWRDADAEITAQEMLSMLDQAQTSAGASGDLSQALALRQDPNSAIYFADAPGPLGSVASIASLTDWSFLGQAGGDLWYGAIQEVRVFFIDAPQADGSRKAGLILAIMKKGESAFTYHGFTGASSMGDEEFESVLSSGGQQRLILRSMDVAEGDLAPVIQLKAWLPGDAYIGKFSTLVGFGP